MNQLPEQERSDFAPACPYCGSQLGFLVARAPKSSVLSKRLVYCCPPCRKVLGVTHRKGLLAI
jgi:hypothetical protein